MISVVSARHAEASVVLDGAYSYQYNAWGRLAKVSGRGDLELTPTGQLASGAAGEWIVHYTYDALGRLARLQRPLNGFPGYNHTEHFYYDGARRVQEVFHSIDAGSGSEQSSEEENTTPTLTTWVDREYIHTAGPGSYVDEFVCEVANLATSQTPYLHLQDANYTVVGLVNAAGAVVRQHTFDAYGQLLYAEDLAAAPWSRVGHQGLFLDRLDAPQGNRDLSPLLTPTATTGVYTFAQTDGLYQNRNRTYLPRHGRFAQGDPNGTGSLVSVLGRGPRWSLDSPEPSAIFTDGTNRHVAYGTLPTNRLDPEGLDFLVGLLGRMRSGAQMFMNYMGPYSGRVAAGKATTGAMVGGVFGGASGGFNAAMNGQNVAVGILVGALQGAFTGAAIGATGGFAHAGGLHFALAGGAAGGAAGVAGGAATGSRGWELVTDGVWGAAGGSISGGLAGIGSDWSDLFFGAGWAYGDAWKNTGRNNGWWP